MHSLSALQFKRVPAQCPPRAHRYFHVKRPISNQSKQPNFSRLPFSFFSTFAEKSFPFPKLPNGTVLGRKKKSKEKKNRERCSNKLCTLLCSRFPTAASRLPAASGTLWLRLMSTAIQQYQPLLPQQERQVDDCGYTQFMGLVCTLGQEAGKKQFPPLTCHILVFHRAGSWGTSWGVLAVQIRCGVRVSKQGAEARREGFHKESTFS